MFWYSLLSALVLISCGADGWRLYRNGRARGGMLGRPHVSSPVSVPRDQWFEQQLDHFSPTDTRTWKQRYFTNASFHTPGAPVFLMIGGEGKASPLWMVEGQWIEYAHQFNALCFQLEHRYYGESHPTVDLSVENLTYLSSEQALADLAFFIEAMTRRYELRPGTRWVAFGGSYPGSLAAWLRAKYPHLVHAAVSTSGPLVAKPDFKAFYGVVRDSLATHSDACVTAVQQATSQAGLLLNHRLGQQSLNKLFRLCDPIDANKQKDVSSLFESFASNFAGVVQYNKDNREFEGARAVNITIDTVCDVMTNSSLGPPVDRSAAVSGLILDAYGQKCLDYTYNNSISALRNVSWSGEEAEGGRQWMYQTCTEFGFYQTSSLEPQLFGDRFPLDFFIQQCEDIFGSRFDSNFVKKATKRTNTIYGGLSLQASRIAFVHGSIDPWHALGVTHTLRADCPAIYITGTAHCANMYPSASTDPPQLTDARCQVGKLLTKWLLQ